MGARESAAMVEARRLVTEEGHTAYAAAKAAGLSRSAIYMSKWYKTATAELVGSVSTVDGKDVNDPPKAGEYPVFLRKSGKMFTGRTKL